MSLSYAIASVCLSVCMFACLFVAQAKARAAPTDVSSLTPEVSVDLQPPVEVPHIANILFK